MVTLDDRLCTQIGCRGRAGAHLPAEHADRRDALQWSQRAAYLPISGRYHAALPAAWGAAQATCQMGGRGSGGLSGDCGIQDLMALDLRQSELAGLVALGNAECGTEFPADVTDEWGAAAADATAAYGSGHVAVPDELVGEQEHHRAMLWGGFMADLPPKQPRLATLLPDGSWSCGPMLSGAARARVNASAPPRCK